MKLYVVHCKFYDASDAAVIYENPAHHSITVESSEEAKAQVKALKQCRSKQKHIHIDGIQELGPSMDTASRAKTRFQARREKGTL